MESHVCIDFGSALLQDKRANLKAHIEKSSEDHLGKTWSAFLKTKHELSEVKGNVDEIQVIVKTLKSEKEAMEMYLQRSSEEFGELKLSEKKLEVENKSLKKEMTELGRKLEKVESSDTENSSLKGVVQTMRRKLEALEREVTKLKVKEPKMPILVITCVYLINIWLNLRAAKCARKISRVNDLYSRQEPPPSPYNDHYFCPGGQKNSYIDSCLKPLYNGHLFTAATSFCPKAVERFIFFAVWYGFNSFLLSCFR